MNSFSPPNVMNERVPFSVFTLSSTRSLRHPPNSQLDNTLQILFYRQSWHGSFSGAVVRHLAISTS